MTNHDGNLADTKTHGSSTALACPVSSRRSVVASANAAAALVPVEETATAASAQVHVATRFFAARLQELVTGMGVRDLETGRVRKLTPRRLQQMLEVQAPNLALSQTHIYRYFHGEAAPAVAVHYEIAVLFAVPPTYFVPDELLPE